LHYFLSFIGAWCT